ncbi:hypothetical protein GIB67_027464 [Kingdonia uniflora]|uniref:Disease resistance N-terminal domain-containing protein n=1 Tax=Kingdonia uniflora TaxID=39325 RepID=A0A7J7MFG4_9MAGN|nr:hypothetical protein GIB67_027464 [Kingdonia uniflora]
MSHLGNLAQNGAMFPLTILSWKATSNTSLDGVWKSAKRMKDNEPIDDLNIYRATRCIGNDLYNTEDGSFEGENYEDELAKLQREADEREARYKQEIENLKASVNSTIQVEIGTDILFGQNTTCKSLLVLSVLDDAEKQQIKNESVKHWIEELKDVAYDIDDVLDEWLTRILKSQVTGVESARLGKKKVWSCLLSPFYSYNKVSLHRDIGHRIKEIIERLDVIASEKDKSLFIWRPKNESEFTKRTKETKLFYRGKAGKKSNRKFGGDSDDDSGDDAFSSKGSLSSILVYRERQMTSVNSGGKCPQLNWTKAMDKVPTGTGYVFTTGTPSAAPTADPTTAHATSTPSTALATGYHTSNQTRLSTHTAKRQKTRPIAHALDTGINVMTTELSRITTKLIVRGKFNWNVGAKVKAVLWGITGFDMIYLFSALVVIMKEKPFCAWFIGAYDETRMGYLRARFGPDSFPLYDLSGARDE